MGRIACEGNTISPLAVWARVGVRLNWVSALTLERFAAYRIGTIALAWAPALLAATLAADGSSAFSLPSRANLLMSSSSGPPSTSPPRPQSAARRVPSGHPWRAARRSPFLSPCMRLQINWGQPRRGPAASFFTRPKSLRHASPACPVSPLYPRQFRFERNLRLASGSASPPPCCRLVQTL